MPSRTYIAEGELFAKISDILPNGRLEPANTTDVSSVHPAKAYAPIEVTLPGTAMEVSAEF
jgi:hypothetical protein